MTNTQSAHAPNHGTAKPLPPQVAEAVLAMDNLLEAIILRQLSLDEMHNYARRGGWRGEIKPIGELLQTARTAIIRAKRSLATAATR